MSIEDCAKHYSKGYARGHSQGYDDALNEMHRVGDKRLAFRARWDFFIGTIAGGFVTAMGVLPAWHAVVAFFK